MKRHVMFLVVLVSLFAAASCAQDVARDDPATTPATTGTAGAPLDTEVVEATITQLESDWVAAIVKKDTATLERLLADDFSGTSPTAHLYSKEMAIHDLAGGTYTVERMELDEISVTVYGDTAIAFTSQEEKSRYGGTDISGHYHYTDVWVWKDGRWQAVASHGSRYATPH